MIAVRISCEHPGGCPAFVTVEQNAEGFDAYVGVGPRALGSYVVVDGSVRLPSTWRITEDQPARILCGAHA